MHASDFEYDGVRLSDIGYTICDFDDNDYQTVTNGSEIVFNTVSTLHGAKFERASSEYDDYLTTTFQICKNQCDREGLEISIHEFRHLMRWLNRKQFHKFKFIDDEWLGFYYEGSFNLSRIESEDKIVGVELELTTNRPYGLMEPRKVFIYAAGEPFAFYSEDDNSLTFSCDVLPRVGDTYNGKTVTSVYTGLKNTGADLPPWYDIHSSVKTVEFTELFANCTPLSCHQWFYTFLNCTSFIGLEYLDTSRVIDMYCMFFQCMNTTEIDVSGFDTSKVTTMFGMFVSCRSVKKLDVSSFETCRVTSMADMFEDCLALTEVDLRSFRTYNVTSMLYMFSNCQTLTTIYANDREFSIENVRSSSGMFDSCSNLVGGKGTVYNDSETDASMAHADTTTNPGYFTGVARQNLTSSVSPTSLVADDTDEDTDILYEDEIQPLASYAAFAVYSEDDDSLTFYYDSIPEVGYTYNGKIASAVYSSFINESFTNATIPWLSHRSTCRSVVFDSTFYSVRPISCAYWFSEFGSMTDIDLSGLDTSVAKSFAYMFYACHSLEEIDISGMDTTCATNFSNMFSVCRSLDTIYSDDSVFNIDLNNAYTFSMFISSTLLVGGNGTIYDSTMVDGSMAHIDVLGNPGYFTSYTERNIYNGMEYVLRDFSDEEGFIYPVTEITILKDGDLTIYNKIEDRATTINNCTKGEVITMDSPVITSTRKTHKLQNDFNWNFFRVANRMYDRDNKLTITLPCTIKLIYSPVAKVGL